MGIIMVTIWVIGIIKLLTKSLNPLSSSKPRSPHNVIPAEERLKDMNIQRQEAESRVDVTLGLPVTQ